MRTGLLTLIAVGSVVYGRQQVGDFAPLAEGTTWEYASVCTATPFDFPMSRDTMVTDSFRLSVAVSDVSGTGLDTTVLLKTSRQGTRKLKTVGLQWQIAIADTFVDTMLIAGDSIRPGPGFRSPVVPVFQSHTINAADLLVVGAGSDSRFCYVDTAPRLTTPPVSRTRKFIQDIGCVEQMYYRETGRVYRESTVLRTFNGKALAALSARQIRIAAHMGSAPSPVALLHAQLRSRMPGRGRCMLLTGELTGGGTSVRAHILVKGN